MLLRVGQQQPGAGHLERGERQHRPPPRQCRAERPGPGGDRHEQRDGGDDRPAEHDDGRGHVLDGDLDEQVWDAPDHPHQAEEHPTPPCDGVVHEAGPYRTRCVADAVFAGRTTRAGGRPALAGCGREPGRRPRRVVGVNRRGAGWTRRPRRRREPPRGRGRRRAAASVLRRRRRDGGRGRRRDPPAVGGLVAGHVGGIDRPRHTDCRLLGPGRRPPAAVRRLAGRPGPGVGRRCTTCRPRGCRPMRRRTSSAGPTDTSDPDQPVRPDGHLRPDWIDGGWRATPERTRYAGPSSPLDVAARQQASLVALRRPAAGPGDGPGRSRRPSCCAPSCPPTGCRSTGRRRRRSSPRFVGPAAPHRGRAAAEQRAAATPRCCATPRRAADFDLRSPGQVKSLLRRDRHRGARHPGLAAGGAARRAPAGRRAAGVAQGRAGRHDVRLRLARRARRRRRPAARRVVGLRRRRRAHDRARPASTTCRPTCAPRSSPSPATCSCGPTSARSSPAVLAAVSGDRALAAATRDDDMYAPVAAQLGVDRADGQGGRARRDVRPDHRPRRPGPARPRRRPTRWRWPTCDDGRPGRPGRARRCAPTAAGWSAWARSTADEIDEREARAGPRPGAATAATRWCRARRPSCSRCGRSRSGPGARRSAPASCCASTTSCSSTPRPSRRRRRPRCSTTASRRPPHRWAPDDPGPLRRRHQRHRPLVRRQGLRGARRSGRQLGHLGHEAVEVEEVTPHGDLAVTDQEQPGHR